MGEKTWRSWPGVRHVRYFVLMYRVNRWYDMWQAMGRHAGNAQHDYDKLDAYWRGEIEV